MKKTIAAIFSAAVLAGCGTGFVRYQRAEIPDYSPQAGVRSMKGYELYSWKSGDSWKFALLTATNAEKPYDVIISQPKAGTGIDSAITQLGALQSGEEIFWISRPENGLEIAPSDILSRLADYCKKRGIVLETVR